MTANQNVHVWQVTGNPLGRPNMDTFFRFGVALIGPGEPGPWKPGRPQEDFADQQSTSGQAVQAFASEMRVGDLILLRTGASTIAAVGIVASEYMYLSQFDDVNGWDLQHARRVRWARLPQEHRFESLVFGANPARCSRTWNEETRQYAIRFVQSPPTAWQDAPLPVLPQEEPLMEEVPPSLRDVVAQAQDMSWLCWDRERFGEHPSEDEMLAHFVVPLFRAVGWKPEQIAVKWRYIDVALFGELPRTPDTCRFVVEAKRLGAAVEAALEQAKGYVEELGVVRDVIVTDGIRYRMYEAAHDFEPVAYANLGRLKRSAARFFGKILVP